MATIYRNGGAGGDLIDGSALIDTFQVQGRAGDDTIIGGSGNDKLYGNEGSDVISGGIGADSMEGGAGDDIYVIAHADLGTGKDSILDFEGVGVSGGDSLRLTGFSSAATLSFVRQSGDDYIYLIQDGSASGEIAVRHAAGVRLGTGDYQFTGVVPPANRAPLAGTDTATVLSAGPRTITLSASALMANDSDPDGNTLRITGVGEASHGKLTFSTNGTPTNFADDVITYTPTADYSGADAFTYTLSDGTVSVTGTVNVTVQAVVTTPPATTIYRNGGAGNDVIDGSGTSGPQQFQGRAGDDTLIGGGGNDKINGNDGNDVLLGGGGTDTFTGGLGADSFVISRSDLSGGAESITDFEGAGDGGLAGGDVLYLTGFGAGASLNFVRQTGRDHIYEVRDGGFTAQIKVAYDGSALLTAGDYQFVPLATPANQAPVVNAAPLLTHGNSILSGKLSGGDADGDAITFSVVSGPAKGTLKLGSDGAYIYAPEAGYVGADSFQVRLDDGRGGVTEAVIPVVVDADIADASPWRDTGAANSLVFVHRDTWGGSFYFAADKARVLKDGVEVVGWTEGGAILGVPQGSGYVLETSTAGVVATRPLAVGVVVVAAGQSNMEGWFTYAGHSKPTEDGIYLWSPTREGSPGHWVSATGAGALAFADTLRLAEPDLPVAFVTGAVGGTKLLPATNVDYWLAVGPDTLYQNTIDQVKEASHGQAALVLWNQGEADSASRVDPLLYAEGMRLLFQRFDADLAPGRIVISGLAFTRGNADALRAAQGSVAEASALIDNHILYVPTSTAIETWDETHLTVPARILQGTETALAVLAAEGTAPPGISRQPGGAGNDSLTGGALIDILQGAGGNDTLSGADGDDILRGETGTDHLAGGAGYDALSGGLDDDVVDGGTDNDDVFGDGGNDTLLGGAGNDQLDGGTGADQMSGQVGDDKYIVDNVGDIVTEVANEGTDTVLARLTYTLTAFVENLIIDGAAALNGFGNALANILIGNDGANVLSGLDGNDSILGGPSNDTLDGGEGNDTLTGGSGIDVMTGGAGDDTFYIDLAGDRIIETADGGADTIYSTVTYTLPANVEAIVLGGRTPIGATGSDGANSLTGNINGNLLDGAGGNDTLIGLSGNDVLRGGLGNDWLQGGEGVDTLVGGAGADTLTGDTTKRAQDIFLFDSLADSGVGFGNRDVVTDFDSMDIFDLRLIDANTSVADDQAFAFVGTAAFTAAGQVRYTVVSGGILIELNVDGDLSTDGEILLTNPLATLSAADFLL